MEALRRFMERICNLGGSIFRFFGSLFCRLCGRSREPTPSDKKGGEGKDIPEPKPAPRERIEGLNFPDPDYEKELEGLGIINRGSHGSYGACGSISPLTEAPRRREGSCEGDNHFEYHSDFTSAVLCPNYPRPIFDDEDAALLLEEEEAKTVSFPRRQREAKVVSFPRNQPEVNTVSSSPKKQPEGKTASSPKKQPVVKKVFSPKKQTSSVADRKNTSFPYQELPGEENFPFPSLEPSADKNSENQSAGDNSEYQSVASGPLSASSSDTTSYLTAQSSFSDEDKTPEAACKSDDSASDSRSSDITLAPVESGEEEELFRGFGSEFSAEFASTSTPFGFYQNPSMDVTEGTQIRILTLNASEQLESLLLRRLKKGWILRVCLGPSLFGRAVEFFTNHPLTSKEAFNREKYRRIRWQGRAEDATSLFADITMVSAGSFHYKFQEAGSVLGSGYYSVEPVLTFGDTGEVLSLDSIQMQSVMPKCLGYFDDWEDRLRVAKETGYNFIHFTPVQMLGASESAYSLADQRRLDPRYTRPGDQGGDGRERNMNDVEALVKKMETEWKVLSLCDIVLNHTAKESPWLKDHPESGYNLVNSPHMRPAYLLDRAIMHLSDDIGEGRLVTKGIPVTITSEADLTAIRKELLEVRIPSLRLWEFFSVDIDTLVKQFESSSPRSPSSSASKNEKLKIIQDPKYRRNQSTVNLGIGLQLFKNSEDFRRELERLNAAKKAEIEADMVVAVGNILSGARYERLDPSGPKFQTISAKVHPLVCQYFYQPYESKTIEEEEEEYLGNETLAEHILAHNGWVMGFDCLKNFADASCKVYFRRELVAWGDSVKLRFGNRPSDCPFLWEHMSKYVEEMARVFHGIRLDNCHSTPINVAQYMLDAGRRVRPDLYVIAELFTSSEATDNIFINRLGINSLIREALNAWDSHEQGRLVYLYGGETVGAFQLLSNIQLLSPSIAHAIFYDATHDNPSPIEKRSAYDSLPSSALVSMACCATGSNRGVDYLVPHHIHVVKESRPYSKWSDRTTDGRTGMEQGMLKGKKALNRLHQRMGLERFSQVFVDQMSPDVVAVTRHCPFNHKSIVLVAHTAFHWPHDFHKPRNLKVQGRIESVLLWGRIRHKESTHAWDFPKIKTYVQSPDGINGLDEFQVDIEEDITDLSAVKGIVVHQNEHEEDSFEVEFVEFPPGSIVAFQILLHPKAHEADKALQASLASPSALSLSESPISKLNLSDLNRVLFRCEEEEEGGGAYEVKPTGKLVYCGLQGFITELSSIRSKNDLGHPFCGNLRDGNWMMEYISGRLLVHESTREVGEWFKYQFDLLKQFPRYLIPAYFDAIVTAAYTLCLDQSWSLMSQFVREGSSFIRALAFGSIQMVSKIPSSPLPDLSPNLDTTGMTIGISLAAGLPHFAKEWFRNWGRDTFISLRGLMILTGRTADARQIILAYAGAMRHGLIPNLLDGGRHARFNCRDAVWWWLQAIQSYTLEVPHGEAILKDPVLRIFPSDDALPYEGNVEQPLHDVIQEAMQRHFEGICFREKRAGPQLDEHMTDNGFNIKITTDLDTGLIFGGNIDNCGTWMDKMGSSPHAGNRGKPATPRDGCAVEIAGLVKSTVRWLSELNSRGVYPYDGVSREREGTERVVWSWPLWNDKIQRSFEFNFYVPLQRTQGESHHVNRREIYKDTIRASQPWTDYQLRCNFPVALVVAPELVTPENARAALRVAKEVMLGPLGMKTLDPSDWAYRGDYDNSNDGHDPAVARGFNYHQGPEWVWPVGFFLRALLHFSRGSDEEEPTKAFIQRYLASHYQVLVNSAWRGLPELTNSDGKHCRDSCETQAWSMATILEVMYDLQRH